MTFQAPDIPYKLNCPLVSGEGPCECALPRCVQCGYTEHDAAFQLDHHLCGGLIPANTEGRFISIVGLFL